LSIARWILSLGIDWARAASTAARSRGLASGSGRPALAATVISRDSLENIAERFLSCAPLRYMMFLNLLWPAISVSRIRSSCARSGFNQARPSAAL
jgi:hypothetical protein